MAVITSLYAIGTKVRINSKSNSMNGRVGLVYEAQQDCTGNAQYGVSGVWWFDHDELEFVELPTEATVAEVIRVMEEEYESEEEEDDESEEEEDEDE